MHPASRLVLLTLALSGGAMADLPKKVLLVKYAGLWNNSPFTSKPAPLPPPDAVNLLGDYALAGVSPVGDGYRVTLLNKKKPEERITVDSDNPKNGFQILDVTRKAGDPLGTVVRMSSSGVIGTVSFDEKLLALAPAPAVNKARPNMPPGVAIPGQPPPPGGPSQRQPRARVVPPSATSGATSGQPMNASAGQPVGQPVGQSAVPSIQNNPRSSRHGEH